ncbi:MAG: RidA family protein [Acidobacteria bacterium]|nr:RidA family protein [Acidobacteriota bacterium]
MLFKKLIVCTVTLVLSAAALAAPKKLVHPKEFAKGRPFSPGLLVGDTLYIAGQVGQDLKTGTIPDDFEAEVKQTLDNIGLVLKEAGMSFDNAVSVSVYLTDMELFQRMNAVYITYFKEPRPVRTTVGIARLVGKAKIEITVTASK